MDYPLHLKRPVTAGPKIAEMRITPIAIIDPPLLNAAGLHAPYALRTVIELITEDGISGISEIPGTAAINASLEQTRSLVIGKDPFELGAIMAAIEGHFGTESIAQRGAAPWDQRKLVHVFSAIEVACLDIVGKVSGQPVVDLLGGKKRERVPFAAYLFYKYEGAGGARGFDVDPAAVGWPAARQAAALDPAGIVAQAKAMCAEFGFQSIKLKGGVFEPRQEVDAIIALRAACGPEVPLRIDPNGVWKVETAIHYGRELEPFLEYLEDPVRGQKDMACVRGALGIPLATNMCTTSFACLPGSIEHGSEDIILSDHHFWGGLSASMELARVCKGMGRQLSMHSNSHLGISLAAMVHLGAALPEFSHALDTHYPWQSDEIIVGGRLRFEGGSVGVPEGPGLGVELDRAALATLHENYITCGLVARDDLVEMRKLVPDWEFREVRW